MVEFKFLRNVSSGSKTDRSAGGRMAAVTRKTECRRWKSGGGGGVMLQQDGGWKGRGESAASGISFREDRAVTRRKTYQPVGIHMR